MPGPDPVAGAGRSGVRLAVDGGSVRVGVAACDAGGVLAFPLATLSRTEQTAAQIAELVREHAAVEVIVGLPRTLAGREGLAVESARALAGEIAALVGPVPVRLVDERLTTVAAQRRLAEAGVRGKAARARIDAAAAVALLETVLAAGS